ncbi:MAG: DPP IV N-terminal domain-containing protein, partial [Saprospiraceae bacterium]|nr:DPP IV N-terminal domain-containing protein [Saprospiraceae bacterium]
MIRKCLILLFAVTGCFFAKAQQNPIANSSPLRIPEIMEGDRFVGFLPQQISWSENNETVYFSWNPEMDTIRSIFKVNRSGASPEVVSVDELKNRIERGTYTRDYSAKVFVKNGDLFLWESQTNTAVQLTNTIDAERSPQFAKKDTWIVYRSGNNLFAWDRQSGALTQLTNIQTGNARRGTILSDQQQWLDQQQDDLFDVLQWQEAQATARQNQRNALAPERPEPFYLGRKRISRIVAGPDARFVAMVLMTAADSKGTKVPNYVSSNGYIQDLRSRAKVGGPQNTYSLHLYDRLRDTFYRVSHHNLPGIYDKPAYLREYHSGEKPYVDTFASPRPVNFTQPIFSESGQAVLVVRSQDNKDRWIVSLNPETGTLKSLDHQRDDAWVAGPGIGWSFAGGTLGWMNDGKTVYFQSEETGYAHLYLMNTETGEKKALTQGAFEILSARLSRDGKTFYVRSNAESPHQQHFYHLRVDDAKMVKITDQPGNYEVTMSPDESHLAIRYSYSNKPWELFIMKNEPQAKMIQVTTSTTQAFQAYPWRDPEIIRFTARDGAQVPARLYRPENAEPGGPAVIFVHGAGYLQNVHQWWSSYFREYMFHNILVDNGYTVLDID